eukprot:jgi/Botrbrau1/22942/Bobra.0030s0018.1
MHLICCAASSGILYCPLWPSRAKHVAMCYPLHAGRAAAGGRDSFTNHMRILCSAVLRSNSGTVGKGPIIGVCLQGLINRGIGHRDSFMGKMCAEPQC